MKNLLLGIGIILSLTLAGVMTIQSYLEHKERERLKNDEFDWSGV